MTNVLVAGPPCAGKSTYVREHVTPDSIVVCFDSIAQRIGWDPAATARPPWKVGRVAEREVQNLIADVEDGLLEGAFVIRTMAGAGRRQELADRMGAEVVLLVPSRAELVARARLRLDPAATVRDIDRWLEREARG